MPDIATTSMKVTGTPKSIADNVMPNLAAGSYIASVISGGEVRFAKVAAADGAPDPSTEDYHPVQSGQSWGFKIVAGYNTFAWCPLSTGRISITDSE